MSADRYETVRNLPTRKSDSGVVTPIGDFEQRQLWYAMRAEQKQNAHQHVANHLQSQRPAPTDTERTLQWVREGRDRLMMERMSPREAFYFVKEREAQAKLADDTAKQTALKSPEVVKALTTLSTLADTMPDSEYKLKTLSIIDAIKESPTDVAVLKTLAVNVVSEYRQSITTNSAEQLNSLNVERETLRQRTAAIEVANANADVAAFTAVANLEGAFTSEPS